MTSTQKSPPLLHDEHFRAFGAIIHQFARHEAIMVGIMCKLMGVEIVYGSMITSELPYRGKRDALTAMIRIKGIPTEQIEKLNGYLGQLHKWSSLRNAIAHRTWKEGKRAGSIKPFGLSVRDGETNFIGVEEGEKDYTAKELVQIANQLIVLHSTFVQYLLKVDLLPQTAAEDGAE